MEDFTIWTVALPAATALVGGFLGWLLNNRFGSKSLEAMRKRGDETQRHARREAEKTKRKAILEAKEEILRQRDKAERDMRSRHGQLRKRERDLKRTGDELQERETGLEQGREEL